jgi:hypothetical protein
VPIVIDINVSPATLSHWNFSNIPFFLLFASFATVYSTVCKHESKLGVPVFADHGIVSDSLVLFSFISLSCNFSHNIHAHSA